MSMQNKLYTIQFSHHPMTELQPVSEQQLRNLENSKFHETPQEDQTARKVQTAG